MTDDFLYEREAALLEWREAMRQYAAVARTDDPAKIIAATERRTKAEARLLAAADLLAKAAGPLQ